MRKASQRTQFLKWIHQQRHAKGTYCHMSSRCVERSEACGVRAIGSSYLFLCSYRFVKVVIIDSDSSSAITILSKSRMPDTMYKFNNNERKISDS